MPHSRCRRTTATVQAGTGARSCVHLQGMVNCVSPEAENAWQRITDGSTGHRAITTMGGASLPPDFPPGRQPAATPEWAAPACATAVRGGSTHSRWLGEVAGVRSSKSLFEDAFLLLAS